MANDKQKPATIDDEDSIVLDFPEDENPRGTSLSLVKPSPATSRAAAISTEEENTQTRIPKTTPQPNPPQPVSRPAIQNQAHHPTPPPPQAQAPVRPRPQTTASPLSLGPLDVFMKDPEITEVMINDLRNVMIEKDGRIVPTGLAFANLEELNKVVRSLLAPSGRVLNPENPYIDVMLPDGSRANIIGPPLTLHGFCITIRKFPSKTLTAEDLIQSQMMDRRVAHFLSLCVNARLNILVSGGTGSGKTTLLNTLISFIPRHERLVTIEDTPELSISHFNSVRLQSKPQTTTSPPIFARELLANALRMRPDRIIIGECRRAEAFDMLQAMNTGHEGSMTSLHANSPRDALSRLETLCLTAGTDLPLRALRSQIQSAVDLIIQLRRFRSGKRRLVAISEVTGMEGETVTLQDIFLFEPEQTVFRFTGFVPTFVERFREMGIELPKNYFS